MKFCNSRKVSTGSMDHAAGKTEVINSLLFRAIKLIVGKSFSLFRCIKSWSSSLVPPSINTSTPQMIVLLTLSTRSVPFLLHMSCIDAIHELVTLTCIEVESMCSRVTSAHRMGAVGKPQACWMENTWFVALVSHVQQFEVHKTSLSPTSTNS